MGDQRAYNEGKNNFYAYTYTSLSGRVTINGVSGKMLEKKDAFKTRHADLPAYSGESDMYFAPGPDGPATQAKLYNKNHQMILDFDWNHTHPNKDGTIFPEGTVHIQEYTITKVKDPKTGKIVDSFKRSKKARYMTDEEIQKYGPLLLHFNPNIKFRP
jgi:hypothetical protein